MIYVSISARYLLAVVFLIAVSGKLRSGKAFQAFTTSISELDVLPRRWTRRVATIVVAGEAMMPILLLAHLRTALIGLILSGTMLSAFSVAITLSLRKGIKASCRCFGASSRRLGRAHLVRNLILIGVAAIGAVTAISQSLADTPGYVLSAIMGAMIGLVFTMLDDVLDLFISDLSTESSSVPAKTTVVRR
ncbi:MauE/DoxX family redox-associated membrane protein [Nonomuraea sp. M3C6]|uniref:MauE/DoxX family redox-associated membrane protein n=1 Tax=Nonomuraea marmarensis TaxID=3351344 RepID=A0ABW7AUG3_9ACTN